MIRIAVLLLVFSGSLHVGSPHAADPYPVDLDQLWQDLGIGFENDVIVFDDDAPLAHIRKAMLKS